MELENKIEKFIINKGMIETGDRIIVGVSGGPDSLCLLNVLIDLKDKYNLKLTVVHINHSLRDEADFEENFVKEFASNHGLEFYSKKVDVALLAKSSGRSTEEVARELRYDFFKEILEKTHSNKIAVAHNKNDNAETVLMNIIRGSGMLGIKGIEDTNNNIIRPLIIATRAEIEEYCSEKSLTPMIDKTNLESIYTRNKVRNKLIPYLLELNPDIIGALNRLSDIVSEDEEFINDYIEEIYQKVAEKTDNTVFVKKSEFVKMKKGLQRRILRRAIFDFNESLKDISFSSIENAISIIKKSTNGTLIKVSDKVKIIVEYDKLKFYSEKAEKVSFNYELNIPGKTFIAEIGIFVETEIVDANSAPDVIKDKNKKVFDIAKTGEKLYVRNRKNGDIFYPTGLNGSKKIKDYLSDEKVDTTKRDKVPLLTNGEEIIWVMGMRTSRKFLKDKSSKEVIIINYGETI